MTQGPAGGAWLGLALAFAAALGAAVGARIGSASGPSLGEPARGNGVGQVQRAQTTTPHAEHELTGPIAGLDCPPVVPPSPRVVAQATGAGAVLDLAFQYDALPGEVVPLELELPGVVGAAGAGAKVALQRGEQVVLRAAAWTSPGATVVLEHAGALHTVPVTTEFAYAVDAPPRIQWSKLDHALKAVLVTWRGRTATLYLRG